MRIDSFHDLNEPAEGFTSINIEWEKLKFDKASEVWNIFPLVTKFSDPFGLKYTDENGKDNPVLMWCYGIWVSRVMWVIAEIMMDDKWLVWPENIAPYSHYMVVMWDNIEKAEKLAMEIEAEWSSVIFDDRTWKAWFGQKAWDADLLGIPNRVVVSPKTIEQGWYELKNRKTGETTIIKYTF
jgi:prolyl-tRNA synthetase